MKRFLLLFAFVFFAVYAFGQSPQTDSLKHLINNAKGDRGKLKAILDLCARFETLPKDTLWNYAVKAMVLATKLHDMPSRSLAIIAQANAYLRWNNADSAKALIAPELAKYKAEDPDTRDIYFELRHLKIDCIANSADYKDALEDNYMLMREAEKYKDSLVIADCLNSLSGYKYEMGFVIESIAMAIKGLSFTSNTPRYNTAIINLCGNLAEYYYWIYKVDSAMYYADKTFKLAKQTGYVSFESWALQKRSAIYIKTKEYGKSENAILEAIKLDEKVDGNEPHDDNLIALADAYRLTKQYDKAIKALTDGLSYYNNPKNVSPHANHKAGADGLQRIFYYKILAKCYQLKGDSKNYEATLERIVTGLDSFYTDNSAQAIADFETKYQVQKKEATIAQQQLALVRENYLFYGSVIIAALGVIIAFLIFREARRKQKLKLRQLQEEERLLSEKAVADAEETERRRIAADLHDNLGAQLSFIKRNVDFIMDQPAGLSQADERKYLSSVNDIAQSAMIDLRETIWVLNKDEVSVQEFADKLKSYLKQQLMGKESIQWHFKEGISDNWKLSSGEVMHLFRIVQEVISNIIKHAEADRINIKFNSDAPGSYHLEIYDDGKGFDVGSKYDGHYGLENIEQRAVEISAVLSITSDADNGTHIILHKEKK
jgi:signal transduction histidine kinase/tetratricopeptide (TPR) repeat protein